MKKLLVLAALTMAAPAAMASKARVEALGNSRQLVDVQYTFERPYLLHSVGEQVTLEWGGDTAAGGTHAEGGFIKSHNDMIFGLYLGKQGFLATKADADHLGEQNPINVLFGMKSGEIAWGLNVGYSNGKADTFGTATDVKSTSTTLNLGAEMGAWAFDIGTVFGAKSESSAGDIELKEALNVGVDYKINDNSQAYVTYDSHKWDGGKDNNATEIGYINTFAKTEDVNFFYGVAYNMGKVEGEDKSALPVWMGVEANATSWMVFRASLRQNIFINEDKTTGNTQDLDSIAFNAGLGIKAGKGMIDATFGTAKDGHLSFSNGGDQFMSQVSYSYMF